MNKTRRKQLTSIVTQINSLRDDLAVIISDEQDYIDNMPESFVEKREAAEAVADSIDEAWNSLEEALDYLGEALE